jgi:predicted PurR-regulated permease PerM
VRGSPRQLLDRLRNDAGRDGRARDHGAASAAETAREARVRESENLELRERIAQQWAEVRAARRVMEVEPDIVGGTTNFRRARVPYGVDLAAAWGWRFLVISATLALILWLLNYFLVVVLPLVIALLIAALAAPMLRWLARLGVPRRIAALLIVVSGLGLIALLMTFVGSQVSQGASDLSDQVGSGIDQIRDWLRDGPLHVTDSQIASALDSAQQQLQDLGKDAVGRLSEVGTTVGHVVAGVFIVLFATYFFLADGPLIWAWTVRLFPRAARLRADSSGRVAWASLTQFVRATVLVAGTDAIGIMVGAAILGVPFVSAIGVLVFIGAFVPMVGAFVSGTVAVLVALVAVGPLKALIMFGVVIGVQQLEAHILQPFLMGRFVSVHPLGVIVAIAMGVLVAGIPGALIAVPLAASLNAVVQHLAADTAVGQGVQDDSEDDGLVGDVEDVPEETAATTDRPGE